MLLKVGGKIDRTTEFLVLASILATTGCSFCIVFFPSNFAFSPNSARSAEVGIYKRKQESKTQENTL